MSTKNKTIFIASMILFIAAAFITASVVLLPDKETLSDTEEEETKPGQQIEKVAQKQEETEEETQKETTPEEIIDDEIQAIINDMEKQETSLETEISYFN